MLSWWRGLVGLAVSAGCERSRRGHVPIQSPRRATFLKLAKASRESLEVGSFFSSTMACRRCLSRSISRNSSLEPSTRTERTLPSHVRFTQSTHEDARHTQHRNDFILCLLNTMVLDIEVTQGQALYPSSMAERRMVRIQRSDPLQLLDPLLLLHIVRANVVLRCDCRGKASLDAEIGVSMLWLTRPSSGAEVGAQKAETESAHCTLTVSVPAEKKKGECGGVRVSDRVKL